MRQTHARRATIRVAHRYDDVEDLLALRHDSCSEIWQIVPTERSIAVPLFPPMNCVTCVSAVLGFRAFTPKGLKRILLRNKAERIG